MDKQPITAMYANTPNFTEAYLVGEWARLSAGYRALNPDKLLVFCTEVYSNPTRYYFVGADIDRMKAVFKGKPHLTEKRGYLVISEEIHGDGSRTYADAFAMALNAYRKNRPEYFTDTDQFTAISATDALCSDLSLYGRYAAFLDRPLTENEAYLVRRNEVRNFPIKELAYDLAILMAKSFVHTAAMKNELWGYLKLNKGVFSLSPDIKPVKAVKNDIELYKAVNTIAAKEASRYAFNCVLKQDGVLVSTDGRRMLVVFSTDSRPDGRYTIEKGQVVASPETGNYPRWQDVMPDKLDRLVTWGLQDSTKLYRELAAIHAVYKNDTILCAMPDAKLIADMSMVLSGLEALLKLGVTSIEVNKAHKGDVLLSKGYIGNELVGQYLMRAHSGNPADADIQVSEYI